MNKAPKTKFVASSITSAIEWHRYMWNWIADKTIERKSKVVKREFLIENNAPIPRADCYCCAYAYEEFVNTTGIADRSNSYCVNCPIKWSNDESHLVLACIKHMSGSEEVEGLFSKWADTKTSEWELASKYAREIAELPAR